MTIELPGQRPAVFDAGVAGEIDEYLRFRHVVRHIYAFDLDPERVERLASRLRPAFSDARDALLAHAAFLEMLAPDA